MTSLYICSCLRYLIYLQVDTWFMGSIISWPKTRWPVLLPFFMCWVERTVKSAATRIPIHGSVSYTYVSCRSYVITWFPNTWCILSMVSFACVFSGEGGLVLIQYSFYTKIFLNSLPSNFPPWSYMISTVHGCQTSHVVFTKFLIIIAFLLLYCVTSKHLFTGSIIVTAFKIRLVPTQDVPFAPILWYVAKIVYLL